LAFGSATVTPVVLDTCVVLWLAGQQDGLSANARTVLADPAVELHVSAISAWEIAIKSRKGRLGLPSAPEVWWQTFLNSFAVKEVAVTGAIAMGAVAEDLPHNDPADRIVVATARGLGAKLLTADRTLRENVPFVVW
jgi:PIN domain nuclease of toxin-antitoxin system